MSSKQAELRRLMKLQREKKELRERAAEQELQHQRLPKGILRMPSNTTVSPIKDPQNEVLSSLLTGYDSDSSQEEDDEVKPQSPSRGRVSWPTDDANLETTHVIPERKQTKSTDDRVMAETRPDESRKLQFAEIERNFESTTAVGGELRTGSANNNSSVGIWSEKTDVDSDSEQWKEFEALIGDDDTAEHDVGEDKFETSGDFLKAVQLSETGSTAEAAVLAESSTASTKEPQEDSVPSSAEVEQASYEARIAKLRLKSLKRRKKGPVDGDDDASSALTSVPTYTPELALAPEEAEEASGAKRKSAESQSFAMSILRQKMARARQLSEEDDGAY